MGLGEGGSQQDDEGVCPMHLHGPHITESYANEVIDLFQLSSNTLTE